MKNAMPGLIALAILTALLAAAPAGDKAAGPDEASLLAAWETALRADANTEVLEKTGERSYRFKTRLFPFDGELKVLNALIQDYGDEEESLPGYAFGSVEVELVGFDQEQMARYARSFSYWYQLNTLYFDRQAGRWLSGQEYRAALTRRYSSSGCGAAAGWLARNYFLLIMALLALFLWWVARKSGRQMKTAMSRQDEAMDISRRSIALAEKAAQQNDESVRLLREILQELKKTN
jgi:hypothetical protein